MNPADPPDLPPGAAAAGAAMLALLCGGVAALVAQTWRERKNPPPLPLPAWRAPLLDFALWLWVLFVFFLAGQVLGGSLLRMLDAAPAEADAPPDFPALLAMLACTQGVWLLAQLGLLRWARWSPAPLNRAPLPARTIAAEAALAWLAMYPVLVLVTLFWQAVLAVLRRWVPGLETPVQEPVRLLLESGDPAARAAVIVFAVVVAPLCEELFFRGGIYRYFKGLVRPLPALVLTNLLFALVHFNVLSFLPLFLVGVLLTRAYERTGHIAVPILFHALFNLSQIALLLLAPDLPGLVPEGS